MKEDFIAGTMLSMRKTQLALNYLAASGSYYGRQKYNHTDGETRETIKKIEEQFNGMTIAIACAERILLSNPVTRFFYRRIMNRTVTKIAEAIKEPMKKGNTDVKK